MAGAAFLRPALSPSPSQIRGNPRLSLSFFTCTSRLSISSDLSSSSPSARRRSALVAVRAFPSGVEEAGPAEQKEDLFDDGPTSIKLEPIEGEERFDRVVAEAQQLEEEVVILWMANWCRKCIYLKPKLEKLAAEYYPRIKFYCIDVNSIPQRLVKRAGITKMPTIQLWKDCKKQGEVIGGHKAWLVVNEVRQMIENQY